MKTVVITGAARGVGKVLLQRFSAAGWQVAACDAVDFEPPSASVLVRRCDVASEAAVRSFVQEAAGAFGGIDCVVNNAAVSNPYAVPLESLEVEDWNRTLAVNLTGPMLLAKHALRHLRESRGTIINISSTRARMSEQHCEAYAASKGGLGALTHALSISLAGSGVRVNAILPGWISTEEQQAEEPLRREDHEFHPCGRVGCSSDVAELALFLADSSKSGFVNGQEWVVDGGVTKKMIYPD